MRLTMTLAVVPVGIVAVLHCQWLRDQAVHCMVGEALRKAWHALTFALRHKMDSLFGSFAVPLVPDPSAILNVTMILGGMASLVCAGMASPRARGILVAGGITAVAVGLSREAARKNSLQQLRLEP